MADKQEEEIDWQLTTFAGNRKRQHREFQALTFREKLAAIEALGEVGALFASQRAAKCDAAARSIEADDADQSGR